MDAREPASLPRHWGAADESPEAHRYPDTPNLGCFGAAPAHGPLPITLKTFLALKHFGDQLCLFHRRDLRRTGRPAQTRPSRGNQACPRFGPQTPSPGLSFSLSIPRKCFFYRNKTQRSRSTHTRMHVHTYTQAHAPLLKLVKITASRKPRFNVTLSLIKDALLIFLSLPICFLTTGRVK